MAMRLKHQLPELAYGYDDLEPHLCGEIMRIHHQKHHQTYVNNLNAAEEKLAAAQASGDVAGQIALQGALKFNGGGHVNHSIFWTNLAPTSNGGGVLPAEGSDLAKRIAKDFGSHEKLVADLSAAAAGVQGSGWAWLGYCPTKDRLSIMSMPNQDPLSVTGLVPLLGIDVWEHAYYLQYKNVRPDYIKAIFNVVNWDNVAERLAAATGGKK
ncbi:Fe-Mn family superoxide dismutase [Fonticula alba]|uniref:Superoxide dismutase n=1 Tax=Fonticula alba TaxID=691883 RepID=A0A058Z7Z7_FONAL|nr:Fe-Mn family superoxide dismutase [Fonticula alba]KCV70414.1 Fe-Mn family superoxide dismutase [Fonticula alba]|eukprot:XP_009494930.1 Fe-Mn family superoxide dismutase [Fonticula alba]